MNIFLNRVKVAVFGLVFFISQMPGAFAAPSSVSGTSLPMEGQILDAKLNSWTLSNGVIYQNSKLAGYSADVILVLYKDAVIYQENTSNLWWSWNGDSWTSVNDPLAPSASGTSYSANSSIVDASKNVWALSGGVVYENGKTAGYSSDVIDLYYKDDLIYQENASDLWWYWKGSTWVSTSNPTVVPSPTPAPTPKPIPTPSITPKPSPSPTITVKPSPTGTPIPVVSAFPSPCPTQAQANSVPPGPFPGDLNIIDYGAVSDGVTDNSGAIQAALNAAAKKGVGVFVPAGNFGFRTALSVNGVRFDGVGNASELTALNSASEAVIVKGSGSVVANLFLHSDYNSKRLSDPTNQPVFIDGATYFHIDHIYIDNSPAGGIGDIAGSHGMITNNTILNTRADSICSYKGVYDVLVDSNYIENSGDDGISVYSLEGENLNTCVTITNNVIMNNAWGRNLSVVGGENITYNNNYANGNDKGLACMYLASEPTTGLTTKGAHYVVATNNTFMNCGNTSTGYAALTFSAVGNAPDTVNNITIQNSIIDPGAGMSDIYVHGPQNSALELLNIEEIGQISNNLGAPAQGSTPAQVTEFTKYTSGPVGYTPHPAGVSGAIPVVP